MSLLDFKGVITKKEIQIPDKATLLISPLLESKIAYYHEKVGAKEWSGILLHKVLSGGIEEPEKFVLLATDFIPMDVGNGTYTEYEHSATDTYYLNKSVEACEQGLKFSQIHTHHNMGIFFSGTDTAELRDHVDTYDYYLSLIVGFKGMSEWKAKIAIAGTETVVGKLETVYTWKKGNESQTKQVTEEKNDKSDIMFTIDCNVVREHNSEFFTRYSEISKPVYTHHSHFGGVGESYFPKSLFEKEEEKERKIQKTQEVAEITDAELRKMIVHLLNEGKDLYFPLTNTIARKDAYFSKNSLFKKDAVNYISDNFEEVVDHYLKIGNLPKLEQMDICEKVAYKILTGIMQYQKQTHCFDVLEDGLSVYLLGSDYFHSSPMVD